MKGCRPMEKKVIYVDFKTASKKSKHKTTPKDDLVKIIPESKPYKQTFITRLKNFLYYFINRKSNKNLNLKYKHWL